MARIILFLASNYLSLLTDACFTDFTNDNSSLAHSETSVLYDYRCVTKHYYVYRHIKSGTFQIWVNWDQIQQKPPGSHVQVILSSKLQFDCGLNKEGPWYIYSAHTKKAIQYCCWMGVFFLVLLTVLVDFHPNQTDQTLRIIRLRVLEYVRATENMYKQRGEWNTTSRKLLKSQPIFLIVNATWKWFIHNQHGKLNDKSIATIATKPLNWNVAHLPTNANETNMPKHMCLLCRCCFPSFDQSRFYGSHSIAFPVISDR